MNANTDTSIILGLRPMVSAKGRAIKAPANAPACMTDTKLAERLDAASAGKWLRPNSLIPCQN